MKEHMRRREKWQSYLYDLVYGKEVGLIPTILLGGLWALSVFYTWCLEIKLWLCKIGFMTRYKLPCKAVSIGNLTIGGTGKTPAVQTITKILTGKGYRVAVLNRGYRGTWNGDIGVVTDGKRIYMSAKEAGDEGYLLAKNLKNIPVFVGKNRYITGKYAAEKMRANVVLMDDAYQQWHVERDLDIVLVDTLAFFGNGFILPRGSMREPLHHLMRADVFVLTKANQASQEKINVLYKLLRLYNKKAIFVESFHSPQCFMEIEDWYRGFETKEYTLDIFKGKKIFAFSAIGNPASFEKTLKDLGVDKIESIHYPDHHEYMMFEMQEILQAALECSAVAIVTTEKDAVKIPSEFIHSVRPVPIYLLKIEIKFTQGFEDFEERLTNVLLN